MHPRYLMRQEARLEKMGWEESKQKLKSEKDWMRAVL